MKVCYQEKRFGSAREALIDQANDIIAEYMEQGYDLTLRQLYYQFVARDILPNNQKSYNNLGSLLSDARLAGLVDWDAIVDRTRNMNQNSHWESPADIVETCAKQFRYNLREDQDVYIEAWIEKEALAGVLEKVCTKLDIPYFSCRGYVSQSEMRVAAQRAISKQNEGKEVVILHLGDHDPSGIDMTRDIRDRFDLFRVDMDICTIDRIALNMDQIEELNPPPNPAKLTDSRCAGYCDKYGDDSWELDALDPRYITDLITHHVQEHTDEGKFEKAMERQRIARKELQRISNNYDGIVKGL